MLHAGAPQTNLYLGSYNFKREHPDDIVIDLLSK